MEPEGKLVVRGTPEWMTKGRPPRRYLLVADFAADTDDRTDRAGGG